MNDLTADVLVYAKPLEEELPEMAAMKGLGKKVVVDFCDDHFSGRPYYKRAAILADRVTCPTSVMADVIRVNSGVESVVIPDPYEFPEEPAHCRGDRILWFGHSINFPSLKRVREGIKHPLRVVSNVPGCIPWSIETMRRELADADIVIMPATAKYKSANRTVEAIRQGCFVVAEPHPSIEEFPIWIGDIPKGVEWAVSNPEDARRLTAKAQDYVREKFSPRTIARLWRGIEG